MRGIIPLEAFHVPSRLARTVRSTPLHGRARPRFRGVIDGCAEPQPGRARTWINARIRTLLPRSCTSVGHCHSVEVYDGGELVGGLYGVSLGRAFFGESMFHRCARRLEGGAGASGGAAEGRRLRLLDTQFVTDHLRTFGAAEVSKRRYHRLLEAALVGDGDFAALRPISR